MLPRSSNVNSSLQATLLVQRSQHWMRLCCACNFLLTWRLIPLYLACLGLVTNSLRTWSTHWFVASIYFYLCHLLIDDPQFPTFTHVTNQKDPVPSVPPRFLSYQHASGEVHITSVDSAGDGTLVACPGQENDVSLTLA